MTAVLEVTGVSKDYRGLRPLRVHELIVAAADRVALVGFDHVAAEVFVNLATGAMLPDAGRVSVFGRPTHEIADSDDWLRFVDRFGIVSARAVLLDGLTALQNLAMPFGLEVDPLRDDLRQRAEALARDVALPVDSWNAQVGALSPYAQMQIRFGRALALEPQLLLLEHVTARLPPDAGLALAARIKHVAQRRQVAVVAMTADESFARAVASRVLRWEPASGKFSERRGWFKGLLG